MGESDKGNGVKDRPPVTAAKIGAVAAILSAIITASATLALSHSGKKSFQQPLEGEWRFKMAYEKFHDRTSDETNEKWVGDGSAVILWVPEKRYYIMLLGAEVRDVMQEPSTTKVSYTLRTIIHANEDGIPVEKEWRFTYVSRAGTPGFTRAGNSAFTVNIPLTEAINEFQIFYESNNTKGTGILTRL